ncbi:MAG TPA: HEAT repeat domain-containing protein [Planctomycetota bacterium]|nr:HEAT repeat domain-containing protein [Planctomycetota bacterium]
MKVHFCDLCNESVPQSDLDAGRAVLRKGRVICARCEALMTAEDEASAAGRAEPSASAPLPPITVGTAGPGPASEAHAAPGGATPPAHAPAHPSHAALAAARSRGGGAGVGLALIAILLAAGLGFWLSDRIQQGEREAHAREERVRTALALSISQLDRAQRAIEQASAEFKGVVAGQLESSRARIDQAIQSAAETSRRVEERLAGFDASLAEIREGFGVLQRHDQELVRLQQRYSSLEDGMREAARTLAALEEASIEPGSAAQEPLPTPPAAPPMWMGLVKQLSDPSNSVRWQAVMALGETRDPEVVPWLVGSLKDTDIFVRMATARMLEDLGSTKAIPSLIETLNDGESAVREAAYHALVKLSRKDLPFDPASEDSSERSRRIKAWQEWWKKEKDRIDGA